uniref:DNA-directed RNA polymerase III subunit n=1 Tax=Varanus komodoensis TaxID=61221 RepID=A0A8D2J3Y6_VARKO
MAGRGGRGRGRGGHMTFNVEAVGIGKGEALPPPTLQPSPLFPPLEYKPVPLQAGEEVEYMLALKQELRGATKTLPYFIKPSAPKKDVERYSDKYQTSGPVDNAIEWSPGECGHLSLATFVLMGPLSKHFKSLKTLEKKEEEVISEEEEEKEEEEEGKEGDEEEYDEEEYEEETDYIMSYFDNGEDFGDDSEDNMDEAIY